MKRKLATTSPTPVVHSRRELEPRRLDRVRGGGLDIAVQVPAGFAPVMQLQHNELLVRC